VRYGSTVPRNPIAQVTDGTRQRMLALLRKFGWNVTSFQILEPGFSYWFLGDDACVAYVDTGRAWVVAGAPIASPNRLAQVAHAFVAEAHGRQKRVAFFATEPRFATDVGMDSILIGQQPIWSPGEWNSILDGVKSLREQVRRASSKQVVVRRLTPDATSSSWVMDQRAAEALMTEWIGAKSIPALGFLVALHPFSFCNERRYYVATRGSSHVGFAAVTPVFGRDGWFIENLIRSHDAPNGTIESLVDATMRDAAASGSDFVTLGLAPLAGAVVPWLRAARKFGSVFFNFSGLEAFKAKFRPKEWCPIYLTYPRGQSGFLAVYDSLVAFAMGGLFRFGLRALLWGPSIVLRTLAVLLVPWTLLVASANSTYWFPSPLVKWAWVAFDTGICVALVSMRTKHAGILPAAVTAFIAVDALITTAEALIFNVPRIRHWPEYLVVLIAIMAPAFATVILWNVRERGRYRTSSAIVADAESIH
jgi:phosphatidylglycerol lysyltransferase